MFGYPDDLVGDKALEQVLGLVAVEALDGGQVSEGLLLASARLRPPAGAA